MTAKQRLAQAINAKPVELLAALCGFGLFFCLFSGYFMLRPVREAMGIRGGDALSAWVKALLDMRSQGVLITALIGAVCAAAWGALGWYLGGRRRKRPRLSHPNEYGARLSTCRRQSGLAA